MFITRLHTVQVAVSGGLRRPTGKVGSRRYPLERGDLRAHFDAAEFAVQLVGEGAAAARAARHVGGGHREALDARQVMQPAEPQPMRHQLRVGPRVAARSIASGISTREAQVNHFHLNVHVPQQRKLLQRVLRSGRRHPHLCPDLCTKFQEQ